MGVKQNGHLGLNEAGKGKRETVWLIPYGGKGTGENGELMLRRKGQRWVEQGQVLGYWIFKIIVG